MDKTNKEQESAQKGDEIVEYEFGLDKEGFINIRFNTRMGIHKIFGIMELDCKSRIAKLFSEIKKQADAMEKAKGIIKPNGPIQFKKQ